MRYLFTEDCLMGIRELDEQHEHLFELVNQTQEALVMQENPRELVKTLLNELKDYASTHFMDEEAYMRSIQDPELPNQIAAHNSFVRKVESVDLDSLSYEQFVPTAMDLLDYLARWLFHHILGSDVFIGKFESPFSFTEKYLTGIEEIDTQHRRLFEIIAETNELIHSALLHDKYDKILAILAELKEYTRLHFADEEAYMASINYPGLRAQKLAHIAFIDELNELNLDNMDDNQDEALKELIRFLLNWLSNHILKMDKPIGEYKK